MPDHTDNFSSLVAAFGNAAKTSLRGPGEAEAQLTTPVATFIESVGTFLNLRVSTHAQVRELDGSVRPDLGVLVDDLLTGHVELKAPQTSLEPSTYGKTTHNYRQWQRLREIPNLIHTNGVEWRLWRYGELARPPVFLHASDLRTFPGSLKGSPPFEGLVTDFLRWRPDDITTVSRLVDTLAPLARMLREEVLDALRQERKARKAGAEDDSLPLLGLSRDWRRMLFPQAKDDEFADGFAQTVVFALLLAVSEGIDLRQATLHDVAQRLEKHHTLMGMALNLLTEHLHRTTAGRALGIITRVLSVTKWDRINQSDHNEDVYLHLYEHFLGSYDAERRKATGSYYTPIEIVDFMVRITDEALQTVFERRSGLRHPSVTVIDSSMGTGTYPLAVLRRVGETAAAEFGAGARPEAVTSMAARLYGIELQSGPFSVAELRLSEAMKAEGASLPPGGLNMFVADTLEDPYAGSSSELSYTAQLIARQRLRANKVKRETNLQVSIGNPPYKEKSKNEGGWVELGLDPRTGEPPLAAFQTTGNANHNQHLRNLYAYFWRWSTWKVFESTDGANVPQGDFGIVCYITATGYLNGAGFRGMREYLRRTCSHGWIINVTPEGRQPPSGNAVFNIQTPVAIALFAKAGDHRPNEPATIKYLDVHGSKEEKFASLAALTLQDEHWLEVSAEWQAPFTPAQSSGDWGSYPAIGDLFPWVAPGVSANRTWVYAPEPDTLEERLRMLVNEDDAERKSYLFTPSRYASVDEGAPPLPGIDVETDTSTPISQVTMVTSPKVVQIGYRSMDRQYLLADSRLIHSPSSLWHGRIPGQVFACEMHTEHPGVGPGLSFSALLPEKHFYNNKGGGGRAIPLLHPNGTVNVTVGLVAALTSLLGSPVDASDVLNYVAGVTAHSGYVAQFDNELRSPGLRVPITGDGRLFEQAVELGAHAIWLQTFGASGRHPLGYDNVRAVPRSHPSYDAAVGATMPQSLTYDASKQSLHLGSGVWTGVSEEVRAYNIGGRNIIDSWFGYRRANPAGKRRSPLSELVTTRWPSEWSAEFSELLSAITQLVDLEVQQETLLDSILAAPVLSAASLAASGAQWPADQPGRGDRAPLRPPLDERESRSALADALAGEGDAWSAEGKPTPQGWIFRVKVNHEEGSWLVNILGQAVPFTAGQ